MSGGASVHVFECKYLDISSSLVVPGQDGPSPRPCSYLQDITPWFSSCKLVESLRYQLPPIVLEIYIAAFLQVGLTPREDFGYSPFVPVSVSQ